jgi:hypothetical protein
MFSRKSCYFFVRPKRNYLELCVFLGRPVKAPQIKKVDSASRAKVYHILHIRHRDEVEAPITDWLREAYDFADPDRKIPKPKSQNPRNKAESPRTKARSLKPGARSPKPRKKQRT